MGLAEIWDAYASVRSALQLVFEDLKKAHSADIETELENDGSLDLNKTVLTALGG